MKIEEKELEWLMCPLFLFLILVPNAAFFTSAVGATKNAVQQSSFSLLLIAPVINFNSARLS